MHALDVLEYGKILDRLADRCETPLGARDARSLRPSFREDEVRALQEETRQASMLLSREPAPPMSRILDLRDPLRRAGKGGVLGGEELFQIGEALRQLRAMKEFLRDRREGAPTLWEYAVGFPEDRGLETAVFDSIEPNGDVLDSASPALAALRRRKAQAASRIVERIQSYVSGKTREYLSDPIYTIRDGRYVVPVKSEHRGKIRGLIHDTSGSGQTVFVEPEEVLKAGNELRALEGEEREEVQRILADLSSRVGSIAEEAEASIPASARLDLVMAKARMGFDMDAADPQDSDPATLSIERGRHPLLDPASVVPIDVEFPDGVAGILITGPNTGGKTVAIKCIGLLVLMAQSGMFVPAREARMGVFSQVWADIGDEQSIAQSLSTFSGHIRNIAEALSGLQPGALVLLDELGAGTDPAEGAALARAVLTSLQSRGAKIVASTHYGELKAFAYSQPGFVNAAMEFDPKSLRPTYRLMMGAPGASQAMRIAERYGLPKEVVEEARRNLGEQERDVARMLERLEQAQRQARAAQSEADRREHEVRQAEERAAQKLAEAEEIRRTVHREANARIEQALRELRLEADAVFEQLKSSSARPSDIAQARERLKAVQTRGAELAGEIQPETAGFEGRLEKGMAVRVAGYAQPGVLLEDPAGLQAAVQMGPLRLTVPVERLTPAAPAPADARGKKPKPNVRLERAQSATTEISLRGMRYEDAERDFDRFLDEAILAGLHQIRIVHGKGEGILRKMVHDRLRRSRDIESFRLGEPGEGGDGVTVALLR